jgi:hypothetical protein
VNGSFVAVKEEHTMFGYFFMTFYSGMGLLVDWMAKWRAGELVASGFVAWDIFVTYIKAVTILFLTAPFLLNFAADLQPAVYQQEIIRHFDSSEEELMIRLAETAYPPRAAVIGCVEGAGGDAQNLPEGDLWWCDEWDGMLLPYAVTEDAIAYYQQMLQTRESEGGARNTTTELTYEATVQYSGILESPVGGYVTIYEVSMQLAWGETYKYGHHGFRLNRTVRLTANGDVLMIFGDGQVEFTSWVV